jgi:glycosyltransferase involved in cell wall biosynthesis
MLETGLRILYSFPDAIGDPGIGAAALYYVRGLKERGHSVLLYCTSGGSRTEAERIVQTLEVKGVRVPHRAVGRPRAYRYHDRRVAGALRRRPGEVDVVHVWPRATVQTAAAARKLGIPTVREVPNTHTAFAYERVAEETERCGLEPLPGHSHTPDPAALDLEEREYASVDMLAIPSDYSRRTFLERGFEPERLRLHQYGFDPELFPAPERRAAPPGAGLRALFVGRCEPRKGLHYALEAWRASGAGVRGTLTICGSFYPGYEELLHPWLDDPSVVVKGFVSDVPELMLESDVLLLPSVEDGSALVTYEAQAAGCVPIVSDASGARCTHGETGLVHAAGDVETLTQHLRLLDEDRALLERLRRGALTHREELTWDRGVEDLERMYYELVERRLRTGVEKVPYSGPAVLA